MAATATLPARLTLDDSQFQRVLQTAGQAAARAAERTGSSWGKILQYASGIGLADLASRAATAIISIGTGGIKAAAGLEQTSVSFETMLGSAEKAKEVLGQIQKLGAETPLEFPELADAGKKLLSFGIGAKELTGTLKRIGDVASGIGAPIGEIADIYGKAWVQGRLFAEDINQLTGRGIPIIGQLAKQFGVTEDKVKGLVESGAVGFKNLQTAFVSMTSVGGMFFGMLEKQGRTAAGRWSTLMDNIGQLQQAFSKPILDTFSDALFHINNALPKLMKGAAEAGQEVAKIFKGVGTTFFAIFNSKKPFEYATLSLKIGLLDALNFVFAKIAGALDAIGQSFAQKLGTAGGALGGALGALGINVSGIANSLGGITGMFTAAANALRGAAGSTAALLAQRDKIGSNDLDAKGKEQPMGSIFKSSGPAFKSKSVQDYLNSRPLPGFKKGFTETMGGALDGQSGEQRQGSAPANTPNYTGVTAAVDQGWGTSGLATASLRSGSMPRPGNATAGNAPASEATLGEIKTALTTMQSKFDSWS